MLPINEASIAQRFLSNHGIHISRNDAQRLTLLPTGTKGGAKVFAGVNGDKVILILAKQDSPWNMHPVAAYNIQV